MSSNVSQRNLSLKDWVRPRLSQKRFAHVEGVVDVAGKIARRHGGVSVDDAETAAWLHDACKEIKDTELLSKAIRLNIPLGENDRATPHLLHGPVAAAVVREELSIDSADVLAAIAEHTLGNVPMTSLSEIVYLADCLEASRPQEYTRPIWLALDLEGELNLPRAMLKASDLNLSHLIDTGKPIHPLTVRVRNHYLKLIKQ